MSASPVGHTGKAKSCVEAWVPTVSIHRPFSFYDFLNKAEKDNYKQIYIGVKKGGHRAGREGEKYFGTNKMVSKVKKMPNSKQNLFLELG